MAKSQVVVCPMISGTGIKNKVLEAMAMKKAIVSTSLGVAGIKCESGTHVIVRDDPKAFAEAAEELLCNDELRVEIGTNARKLVEKDYSWDSTVRAYDRIYDQLLMGTPG